MEFWLIQDLPIVLTRFNFKFNILKISILIVIYNVNVVELMSKISQKKFQISIYGTQEATYMTNPLYWFRSPSEQYRFYRDCQGSVPRSFKNTSKVQNYFLLLIISNIRRSNFWGKIWTVQYLGTVPKSTDTNSVVYIKLRSTLHHAGCMV